VVARPTPVRVRPGDDVGHLPNPAAPSRRGGPGQGSRAGQRPARGLRGRGQPPHRLSHGQGRRPLLPPGQRPRPHLPRRPLCPRCGRHRLGVGPRPHGSRPAPSVRRGLPRERRRPSDLPHPRPRVRLPLHGSHRPPPGRRSARRTTRGDGRPVAQRVRPGDGPARRIDLLRGRQVELLVPTRPRHGRPHLPGRGRGPLRRTPRPVLRLRCRAGEAAGRRSVPPRGDGRIRPRPLRGVEQRTRHGRPVELPLARPSRPDCRRGELRRHEPVQRRARTGDSWLTIETEGFVEPEPDRPAQYVRSLRLDGTDLDRSWLTAGELHGGGTLVVELGSVPSRWATTTRPPSDGSPSDLLTQEHTR